MAGTYCQFWEHFVLHANATVQTRVRLYIYWYNFYQPSCDWENAMGKCVPALSGQKSIVLEVQTDGVGKPNLMSLKAEYDMQICMGYNENGIDCNMQ